ncbi:protein of unknown function [Ignavigranum ruoffiae]|uniref:DUF771 domain-containing protein n=1 Tax=Ignavigranum ruoffiae TaxID=89093 RepID=A0A1H9BW03_9LACT|nr:DUF771 domain-containing protein [Ignavigranum ruoffiae]SEP93166.1 protein of unknown function [Ignavigranum ruoffiae]
MSIAELLELEKESLIKAYEQKIAKIEQSKDDGVGDMKWLREKIGISSTDTIKEILLIPFKDELQGKLVFYSDVQGKPWRFNKQPLIKWLEENFERIDW